MHAANKSEALFIIRDTWRYTPHLPITIDLRQTASQQLVQVLWQPVGRRRHRRCRGRRAERVLRRGGTFFLVSLGRRSNREPLLSATRDAKDQGVFVIESEEICVNAASREVQQTTSLGKSSCSLASGFLERTTFARPGKGRNFFGMLSHVFLPITTAFCCEAGASVVTRLK